MPFFNWFLRLEFLGERYVRENYWINLTSENKIISTATLKLLKGFLQISLFLLKSFIKDVYHFRAVTFFSKWKLSARNLALTTTGFLSALTSDKYEKVFTFTAC